MRTLSFQEYTDAESILACSGGFDSGDRVGNVLRRLTGAIALIVGSALLILVVHDVPTALTVEDHASAEQVLATTGHADLIGIDAANADYETQIRMVLAVQDAVLKAAPGSIGIPLNHEREPKNLLAAKSGLCFDRSRTIEKVLRYLGIETRHVAVYETTGRTVFAALTTPDNASHALTEARTQRGWILIDSNLRWIGLDPQRNPVSVAALSAMANRNGPWAGEVKDRISWIFKRDFTYILGLYSRHGRFYPPYSPVPDMNLRELAQNITG